MHKLLIILGLALGIPSMSLAKGNSDLGEVKPFTTSNIVQPFFQFYKTFSLETEEIQQSRLVDCLANYLAFTELLQNNLAAQTSSCASQFADDPSANLECQFFAHDMYIGMHAVADAAYDRCRGNSVP